MSKFDQKIALLNMRFGAMFSSFNSPEVVKQEPVLIVKAVDGRVLDINDDIEYSMHLLEEIESHQREEQSRGY